MMALFREVFSRPFLGGAAAAVMVLFALHIIQRLHRRRRRHRRRANKHFMAGYRAAFHQARRVESRERP